MMISRLALNLRKVGDRETNMLEWMSRTTVLFAPNPELPVRTQTQVTSSRSSEMGFPSDIR